ncbi:MAG: hypothetical protein ACYSX1_09760 [Planctomycetota bacterium]|jgi:hypothetical protein
MGETVRKSIMLGVIVTCLVGAGFISLRNQSWDEGMFKEFEGQSIWVKCRNSACGSACEMNKAEYFRFVYKNADYSSDEPPALTCKDCGEASVYEAVKCASCEDIFEEGTVHGDFADRCPKCGYSQIEVGRREAAEARQARR